VVGRSRYPLTVSWLSLVHHTSLSAFRSVLADPQFWASLTRTVVIAGVSATIATTVATIAAFAVARSRDRPLATGLDILASSSLAIPAVIAGFSAFLFYLVINRWTPLSGTIWAMAIAYAYRLSVSYRTSHAAALQIHAELDEAAAVSGASRLTAFRRIVVPLLLPTAMAVWIQLFILGGGEFTLAAFLSTAR
jgi:iron(III) transport system permease protein